MDIKAHHPTRRNTEIFWEGGILQGEDTHHPRLVLLVEVVCKETKRMMTMNVNMGTFPTKRLEISQDPNPAAKRSL